MKDILIPSEEMRIQVYPMDYQEFCDATGSNYELLHEIYNCGTAIGQTTNRKLMRDLRIYMAVGGMPQTVEVYVNGKNFSKKFSQNVNKVYLISQKDVGREENLLLKPFYFIPFLI